LSSMEAFIIITGLGTAAVGALLLLSTLACRRAQLVKAYNLQQEIEQRKREIEQKKADEEAKNHHAARRVGPAKLKPA